MSRLSELEGCAAPHKSRVGPHQFRRIGDFILVVGDAGRHAFLSPGEYREFLKGLKPEAALRDKLQSAGLMRDAFAFDDAAHEAAERSLLAWPGPSTHVLRLGAGGRVMAPETARRVVDFAFSAPGPGVALEFCAESLTEAWGALWFAVQYARRKSEWSKRPVALSVRWDSAPSAAQQEFLDGHRVESRARIATSGPLSGAARRVIAEVRSPALAAAGWIDRLAEAGVESVLLEPAMDTKAFLAFYAAALDRMLQLQGRLDIREERAMGFLSGRRWLLPGNDLLSELCYAPDGGIYSSELAARLEGNVSGILKLGDAASARYEELAESPAVRAVLAAGLAENQPMCSPCAYRPFCAIPPSQNLHSQGTLWGRHPSSPRCALHMAVLDLLFARLARAETAEAMRQWMT